MTTIAKINGDTLVAVGHYRYLYPNTKHPSGGPTDDWLLNASCVRVVEENLDCDFTTHRIEEITPYLSDGKVHTRRVVALTSDEIAVIAGGFSSMQEYYATKPE